VKRVLRVRLKYGPDGERLISRIERVSRPGRRVYSAAGELPRVQGGMGIAVVSTNRGLLSDREARTQKLGGEVLAAIW
jgi:small subunit ribosomal protein S8